MCLASDRPLAKQNIVLTQASLKMFVMSVWCEGWCCLRVVFALQKVLKMGSDLNRIKHILRVS